MEFAVVALSIALATSVVVNALLAGSVPFLWHRAFKLEQKIDEMDAVLADFLAASGVPKAPPMDARKTLASHFPPTSTNGLR